MNEAICNGAVTLLKTHPELYDPLYTAVNIHKEKGEQPEWMGFEWHELPVQPATLKKLVLEKVVRISYKTRNRTLYNLTDPTAIEQALKFTAIMMMQVQDEKILTEEIPPDLFDDVLGYEDLKTLFYKTVTGNPEDRVHFLMIGPPASAKSLFLFCLEKLPKTKYVLGSRVSRAGLADYLANNEPRFLLIDEIDKMVGPDYAVLLSLCETGRVTEMLYGKTREVTLDTVVFACGNRTDGMPPEVISRFQRLDFFPYSETEFMEVVNHVLTRRDVTSELATYIGQKVSSELNTRDVRQALRVSKLAKNKLEVDNLIRTLQRYMKNVSV